MIQFNTFLFCLPVILSLISNLVNCLPVESNPSTENGIYGPNATEFGPTSYGQTYFPPPNNHPSITSGDQELFQNLLSAEWIVDGLYAKGLEFFEPNDFVEAGYPNDTYTQLQAVYQNENGHLRLFENAIDSNNVKPGRCTYTYGFETIVNKTLAVLVYMDIVSQVEIGSMAYLTGLAQEAKSVSTLNTIMGTISAETRHLTFVNGQLLEIGSFVGPTDTTYPWPLQILSVTKQFIVPNSCPLTNPTYPSPDQRLPKLSLVSNQSNIQRRNGTLTLHFTQPYGKDLPGFNQSSPQAKNLYAIFFHSVFNYTVPASITNNGLIKIEMPTLTSLNGNLLVSLSNTSNVQNKEDIIAGPLQIELGLPGGTEL